MRNSVALPGNNLALLKGNRTHIILIRKQTEKNDENRVHSSKQRTDNLPSSYNDRTFGEQ